MGFLDTVEQDIRSINSAEFAEAIEVRRLSDNAVLFTGRGCVNNFSANAPAGELEVETVIRNALIALNEVEEAMGEAIGPEHYFVVRGNKYPVKAKPEDDGLGQGVVYFLEKMP